MIIKVTNDGDLTFCGEHKEFLEINENDGDVCDMVYDAIQNGKSERLFFSGRWTVRVIGESK